MICVIGVSIDLLYFAHPSERSTHRFALVAHLPADGEKLTIRDQAALRAGSCGGVAGRVLIDAVAELGREFEEMGVGVGFGFGYRFGCGVDQSGGPLVVAEF
jgi:hypothetical protein